MYREVDLQKRVRPFRQEGDGPKRQRSRIRPLYKGTGYEIAASIEGLVAAGHNVNDVWEYTPRQLAAYTFLAVKRQTREAHRQLSILALSQAEGKEITKQLESWEKDAD